MFAQSGRVGTWYIFIVSFFVEVFVSYHPLDLNVSFEGCVSLICISFVFSIANHQCLHVFSCVIHVHQFNQYK